MRNHGLKDRDTCENFGINSRLDTIQAVIARIMLKRIHFITKKRIENSKYLDSKLIDVAEVRIPNRLSSGAEVFHLYSILVEKRDQLKSFLNERGIDARVHYPVPIHLQPAAKVFGYQKGDFPNAEYVSKNIISLPVIS